MLEAGLIRNSQKLKRHPLLLFDCCGLNPWGWRKVFVAHLSAPSSAQLPSQALLSWSWSLRQLQTLRLGFIWLNTGTVSM